MTLKEQIGQRLMTGFHGTELTDEYRKVVREYKIANVILFRENIESCAQLRRICGEIQRLVREETGHGALIAIDQEGGVVSRLPADGVNVPGAMAIAATGDPANAYRAGLLTGRQLRALGVNFDFAPVADVNTSAANPVIGARSYGDDPAEAGRYACEMARGLADGGVLSSAKHFPGHGDTDVDSHLALPKVDKSREELEKAELVPFRMAVAAGIPAIMTTHILFPQIEPEYLPATMSRRILTGLLREEMGFDGLIVSDCMEMLAIKNHFGTVNGTIAAMGAGVDVVLISHDTLLGGEAAEAAALAVAEGELDAAEMERSAARIMEYKKKWVDGQQASAAGKKAQGDQAPVTGEKQQAGQKMSGSGEEAAQVREPVEFDFAAARAESLAMLQKTITEVHRPVGGTIDYGKAPLCIGCRSYRSSLVGNADGDRSNLFGALMAELLGGEAADMTVDPDDERIAELAKQAKGYTAAVVGLCEGHRHPGQQKLVHTLAEAGVPTIAVSLRAPYDLAGLPDAVWSLAAFEYSEDSIRAAAKCIKKEAAASGRLPVKLTR